MSALLVLTLMMMGVMLSSFYVFAKSIRYAANIKRKILVVVWCLAWSFLYAYAADSSLILLPIIRPIACLTSVAFVFFITRRQIEKQREFEKGQALEIVVSAYLLSFGISIVLNLIAGLSISIPYALLINSEVVVDAPIDLNQPIYILIYTLIAILQIALTFLFFRIRRFRNGFPFIFKKYTIVAALIFTGVILILVTWINIDAGSEYEYHGYFLDVLGVLIAGVGIYILVRRWIKTVFKRQLLENRIKQLENELSAARNEIKQRDEDIMVIKSANHNIKERLQAAELFAIKASNAGGQLGEELTQYIKSLSEDYKSEISKIGEVEKLSPTNVPSIDRLLESLQLKAAADNIQFNLVVSGSINYMTEKILPAHKLETLIGDHVNDAIVAINASDSAHKSIIVKLGELGDFNGLCIHDSGVAFDAETLLQLGTEPITTYGDKGGSGYGFYHTFNTIMKEYGASVIIEEKEPSETGYTKTVTILFDGQCKYIIKSPHADELNKYNERDIIIEHK